MRDENAKYWRIPPPPGKHGSGTLQSVSDRRFNTQGTPTPPMGHLEGSTVDRDAAGRGGKIYSSSSARSTPAMRAGAGRDGVLVWRAGSEVTGARRRSLDGGGVSQDLCVPPFIGG